MKKKKREFLPPGQPKMKRRRDKIFMFVILINENDSCYLIGGFHPWFYFG